MPEPAPFDYYREATKGLKYIGERELRELSALFEVPEHVFRVVYLQQLWERGPGDLPLLALPGGQDTLAPYSTQES